MKKLNVLLVFLLIVFVGSAQSPGNVGLTNMSIWYSGDNGVSDGGTLNWADRSGNTNDAQQPTGLEKASQINLFNFNQTFTFDGSSDRFAISDLNYIDGQDLSDLSAFVVYATGFTDASLFGNWSFIDFDRSESFNFYIHGDGRLAMSYQSGGTKDLVATTTSNNGSPHIATYLFDSGETNESVMRLDGFEDYSENNTSLDITVLSDRYGFIADGSEANVFNGSKNNIYYEGDIAEIIFYDQGDLTATDVKKIESYLALKYGISLDQSAGAYVNSSNTTIWDNTSYWNGVAGLIQDDNGAINQKIATSNSYDNFIVAMDADFVSANNSISRSDVGNGKSLLFGHNNGSDGFTGFGLLGIEYLFNKTWLFQEKTGDVGNVIIAIDKTLFTGELVDVIVSSNDTFDVSDTRYAMTEGTTHYYVAVNIANESFVSFIMTQAKKGPGGVLGGLEIWFKADVGLSGSGSNVSGVFDQTFNGNNLSQVNASNQPSNTAMTNFNTNLTFDGSSNRMPIENKNYTSVDNLNQVYVWTVFNTDFSNTTTSGTLDSSNWAFLDFDRSEWFNTSVHGDGTLQFGYNSGGIKDNYGVEVTNDGTAKVGGFIFDTSASEDTKIRVNGNEDLASTVTSNPINSSTTRFGYVGDGSEALTFNSDANNGYFEGSISEVIYYENQTLTAESINKIESYLAVKYGITLHTSSVQYLSSDNTIEIWNNTTYWNAIIAIGKDEDSGLNQKQSKSTNTDAILTIALGTSVETTNIGNTNVFDDNFDFFAVGNNDESVAELDFSMAVPGTDCQRIYIGLERDWKVKNTGFVTGVSLEFDVTGFGDPDQFDLIVDEDFDGDYTTGTQRIVTTGSLTGTNLLFSNITLNDGEVFTLVRKDPSAQIVYQAGTWLGGSGFANSLNNSGTDLLKSVHILESVTLPTTANCKCLEVDLGTTLVVEDGKNLLVSDVLDLEGTIYLYGDAELVQTSEGVDLNTGDGSLFKMISEGTTSEYRFNYWGAPVRNGTTYDLETNLLIVSDPDDFSLATSPSYTTGYNGSSGTISSYWLYDFNNSLDWNTIDETTDKLKGSGFTMKGLGETTNFVFSGKPNNGDITLDIDEDNYYLLGNPYPSEINGDDFNTYHTTNFITDGVIYFWDQPLGSSHNRASYGGGYATRIAGVGAPAASIVVGGSTIDFTKTPNEFIAVGQGFLVTGVTDGSEIIFKNSFRDFGSSLFFKAGKKADKTVESPLELIRLGFEYDTPDGIFHRQIVASPRGMTFGFDLGKDARMFDYLKTDMYWDLEDDSRYIINSVPYLVNELEIPLGLVLEKKTAVTIKIDAIEIYSQNVFLLDKQTLSLTDLSTEEVKLNLDAGAYEGRFSLFLKIKSSLSLDHKRVSEFFSYYNFAKNNLVVISEDLKIKTIEIVSLTGVKLVSFDNFENKNNFEVPLENISEGIYVVKYKTSEGIISKKIAVATKKF
tara:strand:- start:6575 stop:10933 length:4359 start_codon:yes stop_codon:yes gene_type:complete